MSERSMRGMMGMTVLTVLALGLLKELNKVRLDTHSMVNGLMVCIRLEPLSRLWGNHDRRNKDQVSSYSECRKEKESGLHRVIRLKWWMTLYHFNVHLEIKETAMKANRSKLVVSLMTRLNYNRVHKEFLRHPCVLQKEEPRVAKGRQLYLRRRWRNVYFRNSWVTGRSRMKVLHNSDAWKDHIRRHPWYRYIPLITWLSTWEKFGLRYLPASSKEEVWMDWPNPEFNVNTDIEENDKVWNEWAKRCGDLMRSRRIEFYEEQDIHKWWSHLHIINKREVVKWLSYDRQDYRWHHSTGAWTYYLGKIPGLKNKAPRTILHHRERSLNCGLREVHVPPERCQYSGYQTEDTPESIKEFLISKRDWDKYVRESQAIGVCCQQRWPKISAKGPGFNSLGNRAWTTVSKEDALEEQRTLCERVARHRVGEHRDGHFSRANHIYINSPYACQEWNLPLFPDHEADMAGTGTGQPGNGKYNVRVINAGMFKGEGKKPEFTWLEMGLTAALMQINPPGFVSGPSQSSEVTYSQPRDDASSQSQIRLLMRDLSRAHDVQQGIAVAKKYEDMPKLLEHEVLNGIGPLNHPT